MLAWWRTAFAAIGVALAVGRLVPEIAHLPKVPFLILGPVGALGWASCSSDWCAIGPGTVPSGRAATCT